MEGESVEERGKLEVVDNFCRKMKVTEFFSGKKKACKDLFSRQKPTASPTGKPGTWVEYKAAF